MVSKQDNSKLAAISSNSAASALPSLPLPNQFSHSLNLKLDSSNFLLWRQQVLAVIRGHGLMKFFTVSNKFAEEDEPEGADLQLWRQQDQLLVWWFLSSISQEILSQLVDCDSAYDIWQSVNKIFLNKSEANVMQLMLEL